MAYEKTKFCIVGAGPAGMTLSHKLVDAGQSVYLIEKESRIGGLAKSYNVDGNIFDIGPKRFHTEDREVLNYIHGVLEKHQMEILRSSAIIYFDKLFEWPLTTKAIFRLPPHIAVKCFLDLFSRTPQTDPESFEQEIKSRYGTTLYETFFRPYTEKFLRHPITDIHSDWAKTGINRSVIDKRVKGNSALELLQTILLPRKVVTKFIYPTVGGFGGFWDRVHRHLIESGKVKISCNMEIIKLRKVASGFELTLKDGTILLTNKLIWSGNLNCLLRLLNIGGPQRIHYLNTIFYNLVIRESNCPTRGHQWIYASSAKNLISRITCMHEIAPYTCAKGFYNMICEVTDSQEKNKYWNEADSLSPIILKELKDFGLIRSAKEVEKISIHPQRDTYPIYHSAYLREFNSVRRAIASFSGDIHLLGRTGAFWYNNCDHSIKMALQMCKALLNERNSEFNFREYFGSERAA